ncbi:sensor histidine kinase [Halorientalis salina]|uniref:sensor histidine kinase n=1 Tax=Halorientalis salina TaxID=2932266 RepID=UPI0010ABF064|nr:ATP-binding protein [Halorientalis salina]
MVFLSASYFLHVSLFVLAAVGCFVSITRLGRITDRDTRRGLLALLLTSGGWAAAHVGFLVSPTRHLKLGWYVLGLILGLAAVGAWLFFCSAYTNRTYHNNSTYRRLAVALFTALGVVKVTNPLHHGYFTATEVAAPFPHLAVTVGPLHWVAMGLSYALAFVGYFMLFELFTEIDFDTRPLLLLVSITALPVGLDLIGYTTPVLIDMTYEPLGVAVFAIGVVFVYVDRFDAVQLSAERDAPVIALDADRHVRNSNQAARRLFPSLDATTNVSLDSAMPTVAERLGSDDPVMEIERDGRTRYFRLTETPYGTATTGLGSTLLFTDVTEREQYRRELERQNDRLNKFAGLVSHDLRNPLNVAQVRLDLLREELERDDEHAGAIERSLARMETLIDEILTLAREGKQVEQWDAVRLSTIVEDCWAMVETQAANVTIDGDLTFEANPDRLKRLFENLFRNAVEHGGSDVTVTVGPLADRTGFYIADDGPGIPAAERDHVFEPGHTTSETGTGFGLAIVADIVAAHGWDVRVTDSAAGGARFEITGVDPFD